MRNNNILKNIVIIGIFASLVFSALIPIINAGNNKVSQKEINNHEQDVSNLLTHTVLGEQCSATWCSHCPSASYYLNIVYNMGYDFEYVALVSNKNTYASSRISELGISGYPTVCFDGGYVDVVGHQYDTSNFINAINTCGARTVANIDLDLEAFWMGGNQIQVNVEVTNNGGSTYNGHLHVYITEKISRWDDYDGDPYHFAMIGNYGINQNVNVGASSTETYTNTWTSPYSDITMGNIRCIASVFAQSNMYTDETTIADPELPNSDPPSTPSQPSGSSTGIVGIPNTYSTSSTEPNGDPIKYGWDWDGDNDVDEWTDYYGSGTGVNIDHSWDSIGTYNVKVKAEDLFGTQSGWSSSKSVQITIGNPPNTPSAPTGETDGTHNSQYSYSAITTDPNSGDKLYYLFDWGDGTDSGWKGPYSQGQSGSATHTWQDAGNFDVTVKAKDLAGTETDWSPSLSVNMGNTAPNRPSKPSGPNSGIILKTYSYSTSASDPEGDSLSYLFDWDDGTDSGWVSTKSAEHTWSEIGTYSIRVRAKDEWDVSVWSQPLSVEIQGGTLDVDAGGPYEGTADHPISFTGSVTGGAEPYSWEWNFGDGGTSSVQNPTHTYSGPGEYTVTLLVTDDIGAEGVGTTTAEIASNPPNVPVMNGPNKGAAEVEQTFTISAIDPDGDDVYYYIEWGDDTITDWQGPYSSGEQQNFTHTWDEQGDYEIRYKAKDINELESDWGSLSVSMPRDRSASMNIIIYLFEKFFRQYPLLEKIIFTLLK